MTKELTPPTRTALTGNTDLEGRIHFGNPADPAAVVLGDMKFALTVKNVDGSRGTTNVKVNDVLSGSDLTSFRTHLATLRDAALTAAGYVDV